MEWIAGTTSDQRLHFWIPEGGKMLPNPLLTGFPYEGHQDQESDYGPYRYLEAVGCTGERRPSDGKISLSSVYRSDLLFRLIGIFWHSVRLWNPPETAVTTWRHGWKSLMALKSGAVVC